MSYDKVNHMIRNKGLDILRIICTLMVVFIHTNYQSIYLLSLCRIAVPIFFMISGYLYDANKSLKKQIVRIIKLIVATSVFYFVLYFLVYGRNLEYAIKLIDNIGNAGLINIIVFNVNPILPRLWYLSAFLLVLLVMEIAGRHLTKKTAAIISVILLVIGLMAGPFSSIVFGKAIAVHYGRNWLFLGLPYYFLGYCMQGCQVKRWWNALIPLFVILLLAEVVAYKHLGISQVAEFYLFTPLLAISVFAVFCNMKIENSFLLFLCSLGKEDSLNVYLNHKLIEVFSGIISSIPIYPVIVFALALLLSRIENYCLRKIRY